MTSIAPGHDHSGGEKAPALLQSLTTAGEKVSGETMLVCGEKVRTALFLSFVTLYNFVVDTAVRITDTCAQ